MACGDSIMDISNITLNIDDISGIHDVIHTVDMEVSMIPTTPARDATYLPHQQTINEVSMCCTEPPSTPLLPLEKYDEILTATNQETPVVTPDPVISFKKALSALPNVKEILQMKQASIQGILIYVLLYIYLSHCITPFLISFFIFLLSH